MKAQKINAEHIWKQLDDYVVPRLCLSVTDRAAYSYLLRHSRLEGKRQIRFSIPWLGRGIRLSNGATRLAVRRLVTNGALRLVERSKDGHVTEVRLPEEIAGARLKGTAARKPEPVLDLEKIDFMQTRALRKAIHSREGGFCFYCLQRLTERLRCLDHVVPRSRSGPNSYRNLVSCCLECNSRKGETSAGDLLRWLYRERRLTAAEFRSRLRALDALASGKLPPPLACLPGLSGGQATAANPLPRKGRPPR